MGCGASTPKPTLTTADDAPRQASADTSKRALALKEIFKECDDDNSGYLSMEEYKQILDSQGEEKTDVMTAIFTHSDAKGEEDGKLTEEEFVSYLLKYFENTDDATFYKEHGQTAVWLRLAKKRSVMDREALMRDVFAACDDDKTGTLNVSELMQICTTQDKMAAFVVTSVFDSMDVSDKEGEEADGKVTVEEFVAYNIRVGQKMNDYEFKKQAMRWNEYATMRVTQPSFKPR